MSAASAAVLALALIGTDSELAEASRPSAVVRPAGPVAGLPSRFGGHKIRELPSGGYVITSILTGRTG